MPDSAPESAPVISKVAEIAEAVGSLKGQATGANLGRIITIGTVLGMGAFNWFSTKQSETTVKEQTVATEHAVKEQTIQTEQNVKAVAKDAGAETRAATAQAVQQINEIYENLQRASQRQAEQEHDYKNEMEEAVEKVGQMNKELQASRIRQIQMFDSVLKLLKSISSPQAAATPPPNL